MIPWGDPALLVKFVNRLNLLQARIKWKSEVKLCSYMGKWSIHGGIKVTGSLVATVCIPTKLGYVFTVGSFSALKSLLEKWLNFHLGPEQSHTNKIYKKWQLRFIMQHTVT